LSSIDVAGCNLLRRLAASATAAGSVLVRHAYGSWPIADPIARATPPPLAKCCYSTLRADHSVAADLQRKEQRLGRSLLRRRKRWSRRLLQPVSCRRRVGVRALPAWPTGLFS
jgi:hypothetical protein